MVFINDTQVIGLVTNVINNDLTGSFFLSAMLLLVILIFIGFAFKIPLEYQSAFILPLMIGLMAFSGEFVKVGGVLLLYMAVVFSKFIFFNDR